MIRIALTPARAAYLIETLLGDDPFELAVAELAWPVPTALVPVELRALELAAATRGPGNESTVGDTLSSVTTFDLEGLHILVTSRDPRWAGRKLRIMLDELPISGTEGCPDLVLQGGLNGVSGEIVITAADLHAALAAAEGIVPSQWLFRPIPID
jgi:hypothetical protein